MKCYYSLIVLIFTAENKYDDDDFNGDHASFIMSHFDVSSRLLTLFSSLFTLLDDELVELNLF